MILVRAKRLLSPVTMAKLVMLNQSTHQVLAFALHNFFYLFSHHSLTLFLTDFFSPIFFCAVLLSYFAVHSLLHSQKYPHSRFDAASLLLLSSALPPPPSPLACSQEFRVWLPSVEDHKRRRKRNDREHSTAKHMQMKKRERESVCFSVVARGKLTVLVALDNGTW